MADQISDENFLEYNRQGLIPGPEETEREFFLRVNYCLKLKRELPPMLGEKVSLDTASEEVIEQAIPITKKLYDIEPKWIPIFFSNYKLAPWHGGCAWIYQVEENSSTGAFFQLRRNYKNSVRYLMYDRNELVSHELCHVGRMMFQEPKYEEILAYRSSKSKFRRWFGPIVQSSLESLIFVLSLFFVILIDLYFILMGYENGLVIGIWTKLLPLGLICFGLIRLWKRQKTFSKCLNNLNLIFKNEEKANAVAYRLRDLEIAKFASYSPMEIKQFISANEANCLRWRLINKAYFQI